jgi:hypothetical protein
LSNCSNISIVDNQLINQTEQNILNDLGSNQNIQWKHNHTTGFIPSFSTNPSTTYTYDNTTLGYRLIPNRPLLNLDNSNGFLGINNSNPSTDLQINSSRSISLQVDSTSSQCSISLKDVNTPNSNNNLIKGSNNHLVLRGGNSDTLFISGGRIGINKVRTNGRIDIMENSATTPFFNFDNSNQINADSNNINTNNHGSYYGRLLVRIEGVGNKWMVLYN